MRHVYLALSLGIVALGLVHIAATPRLFTSLTPGAVWFASGGLAIILTGTLNLLRREYGQSAFGLRIASGIANIVMAIFALLAGYVTRASFFSVCSGHWSFGRRCGSFAFAERAKIIAAGTLPVLSTALAGKLPPSRLIKN